LRGGEWWILHVVICLGGSVPHLFVFFLALLYSMEQSALCRAAVPQAADLIGCMGANCPAAVPCLLRGCLDVCQLAQQATPRNLTIENVAKKGKSLNQQPNRRIPNLPSTHSRSLSSLTLQAFWRSPVCRTEKRAVCELFCGSRICWLTFSLI
jgi:hypothetical protein